MTFSQNFRKQLQSTDDGDGILLLIIIEGTKLGGPVHVVSDTRDWVIGDIAYIGLPVRFSFPTDQAGSSSSAQITIDNVSRELVQEIEALQFGDLLDITLRLVTRNNPTFVEWEYPATLQRATMTTAQIVLSMGDDTLLRQSACLLRYDPITVPGVF